MIYGNILKELRTEKNLKIYDISKILKIEKDVYGQYEREYVVIPIKHLNTLSNYFQKPLDYIFQLTSNTKYIINFTTINKTEAGKRLKEFRKDNKLTQSKLATILKTERSVISKYERGINIIATPFLFDICKKYKISADYLLGKIDSPKYLN